jgi:LysM repeat protein
MILLKHLLTETTIDTAVNWAKTFQADLGLTPEAASAMAANIQHESEFIADRVQGTGVQRGTLKDSGNLGYSWAQWTHDSRKTKFKDFVKFNFKTDITKTPALSKHAYAFLKYDVQTYKELKFDFNLFKKSKDVDAATEDFVTKYEGAGTPRLEKRQATAREILNKIKPKSKQTAAKPATNINKSVTHIVKSGDTLSELAEKYKITIQQLKQINGLTSDNIKIGQKLYVQLTKPVQNKKPVPTTPKQTIKDNPWDDLF